MRCVRFSLSSVVSICAAFALLLSASPLIAAEYVSIISDNVNVRSGPGTNYQIAMELYAGYPLQVVDKQGEWLKVVDFENDSGWIHGSLVEKAATVIINAKTFVNMRAEATTASAIVATVERGVVMAVLENKGEWLKLRHSSGTIGWIHKSLLWP